MDREPLRKGFQLVFTGVKGFPRRLSPSRRAKTGDPQFCTIPFGEGIKVAIEIALMAADAGMVSIQSPCISIGGTATGVDAALVLIPANAQNFFDLRVLEILAKPRLYEWRDI